MRIIGLTGSIACGKSNVSQTLSDLGAGIVDGDLLSRELTAENGIALPAIRAAFGDGVFLPSGSLDRKALGRIVFGDPKALETLNGIMRPLLRQLISERIEGCRDRGFAVCVLDMPLLYEEHLDALCDTVWCVWLPKETQLQRLMDRDRIGREAALARMNSQLSADEKAGRANVVIDTSGSISYTKAMIPALYEAELAMVQA